MELKYKYHQYGEYICEFCGFKTITSSSRTLHLNTCKENPNTEQYKKYHSKCICEICNKEFIAKKGTRFCSRKCANTRKHTKETKDKIKNGMDLYFIKIGKQVEQKYCKDCNKKLKFGGKSIYCTKCWRKHKIWTDEEKEKQSIAGRYAATFIQNRSKNEIAFCELCEQHFNNVKHNEPIFNGWDADIIIEDYKIAVLWNGKWHYEKIMEGHSLEQVQNRDKIKIEEIKNAGYVPYIIKDMGSYDINKVNEEFTKFIEYTHKLIND